MLCSLFLAIVTFALFWPVQDHAFINYDDPDYIAANPVVQAGLTWGGIKWAFTSSHAFNWHPVTWISHMLDAQFFGMNAGAHHLVSVAMHTANVVLLFALLWRMTGALGPPAFVAAVFAWHPLHIESVAWACERKDVLSTFFWLATTWLYFIYVKATAAGGERRRLFYILAMISFALGLMAKPMLVTLPFTLLLLDWWPLRRSAGAEQSGALKQWRWLILEKVPFFLLTVASSIVTFLVQQSEGAVVRFEHLPLSARLANALISYVRYLGKVIWPTDLSIYYQPSAWSHGQVLAASALLLLGCVLAWRSMKKEPAMFVGWFWFLGTLVPVIGIVQVGAQAIADRYMYVPLIGLTIAIAWPVSSMLRRLAWKPALCVSLVLLPLGALCYTTSTQLKVWRNSESVFSHAIAIDPQNVVGRVMLANAYLEQSRFAEAEKEFLKVLELNPRFPEIRYNLGNLYVQQQRSAEAIIQYEAALALSPNYSEAHANLAVALGMEKRFTEAIAHYQQALTLNPNQPDLLRNLALDLLTLARFEEAVTHLKEALKINPGDAFAHLLLGNAHVALGKNADAIQWYTRALELHPNLEEARTRLTALQSGGVR